MKISIWMHIEHEMVMKNQCWIVDGGEGSMSAVYISDQLVEYRHLALEW